MCKQLKPGAFSSSGLGVRVYGSPLLFSYHLYLRMSTLFDIIVGISHSKCQIVDKEQHGCMWYTKHLEMFTELLLELEFTNQRVF